MKTNSINPNERYRIYSYKVIKITDEENEKIQKAQRDVLVKFEIIMIGIGV